MLFVGTEDRPKLQEWSRVLSNHQCHHWGLNGNPGLVWPQEKPQSQSAYYWGKEVLIIKSEN